MLKFMSESPWLTFFLALIAVNLIVGMTRAITGNYPPTEHSQPESK